MLFSPDPFPGVLLVLDSVMFGFRLLSVLGFGLVFGFVLGLYLGICFWLGLGLWF